MFFNDLLPTANANRPGTRLTGDIGESPTTNQTIPVPTPTANNEGNARSASRLRIRINPCPRCAAKQKLLHNYR